MPFTYGDCKKEMDMVNKAFIEMMIEGDANGTRLPVSHPDLFHHHRILTGRDTENNKPAL